VVRAGLLAVAPRCRHCKNLLISRAQTFCARHKLLCATPKVRLQRSLRTTAFRRAMSSERAIKSLGDRLRSASEGAWHPLAPHL
jgi:hypothetical protein